MTTPSTSGAKTVIDGRNTTDDTVVDGGRPRGSRDDVVLDGGTPTRRKR